MKFILTKYLNGKELNNENLFETLLLIRDSHPKAKVLWINEDEFSVFQQVSEFRLKNGIRFANFKLKKYDVT